MGVMALAWRRTRVSGSTKTMGALTVGALVVVTGYTVALGNSGWLWFGWVVLALVTLGTAATGRR